MSKQILKRRIKAATQIEKVTRAMSNVAGRKLTLTIPTLESTNVYYDNLLRLISSLPSTIADHRYIKSKPCTHKLLIVVSTDKGLVGALNRDLDQFTSQNMADVSHAILIGSRATRYHIPSRVNIIHAFSDIGDYPAPEIIAPIANLALSFFEEKLVDGISVVYQNFETAVRHHAKFVDCLPIDQSFFTQKAGEYYSYDLPPTQILESLVREYLVATVFKAVISGKATEHATRVIAMQAASDNAETMKNDLRSVSFKNNQKAVTAEIADTIGARFALNN